MLDIDYFKAFNDAAGHQAGDDCLRQVAQTLRESLHRAGDVVARYGGEEFVILLPETDSEHASLIAESLRERIEQLGIEHIASPMGRVTVSIGVASIAPPRDSSRSRKAGSTSSRLAIGGSMPRCNPLTAMASSTLAAIG